MSRRANSGDCESKHECELGASCALANVTLNAHNPGGAKAEVNKHELLLQRWWHLWLDSKPVEMGAQEEEKAAAFPRMRAALQTRACMRAILRLLLDESAGRC